MTKICFCSGQAYPILTGKNMNLVGGAELQQMLLGKELFKKGYEVSFIEGDFGQKSIERIAGFEIYKLYPRNSKIGIVRHFLRLRSIWKALELADADIYYQRSAGIITGIIAFFCKIYKRKFVYSVAHDMDVDGTYIRTHLRNGILYKIGIKISDIIITQNERQQKILLENLGLNSVVIKSAIELIDEESNVTISEHHDLIVLWAATIREWKQPELFLKIAREIPGVKFHMIGGSSHNKIYYETIKESAKYVPNLDYIGFIPYHEINSYFDKASIFVNTSIAEGFPNTFLQAWSRAIPVVSLNVDPDEIICKYNLGFHSKTLNQMIKDIETLINNRKLSKEKGYNGFKYIKKNHDIKTISENYMRLFEKLVNK